MPKAPNFPFIDDGILRENLEITFAHLIELLSLSALPDYTETLRSSFRKTVIIYTASIIEALLMWMLKKHKTEDELAERHHEFKVDKVIYEIDATNKRIVLGRDEVKTDKCRFEKLNLDQVNDLCKKHNIVSSAIFDQVDKVRMLRNRLHISTLKVVEKDYSKEDLEFVFSVAREVKNLAK